MTSTFSHNCALCGAHYESQRSNFLDCVKHYAIGHGWEFTGFELGLYHYRKPTDHGTFCIGFKPTGDSASIIAMNIRTIAESEGRSFAQVFEDIVKEVCQ